LAGAAVVTAAQLPFSGIRGKPRHGRPETDLL
jgi:hypothetical protein